MGKWQEYMRVLKITKKPDLEEFWTTSKVATIGIAVVGVIGFTIYLIANIL